MVNKTVSALSTAKFRLTTVFSLKLFAHIAKLFIDSSTKSLLDDATLGVLLLANGGISHDEQLCLHGGHLGCNRRVYTIDRAGIHIAVLVFDRPFIPLRLRNPPADVR